MLARHVAVTSPTYPQPTTVTSIDYPILQANHERKLLGQRRNIQYTASIFPAASPSPGRRVWRSSLAGAGLRACLARFRRRGRARRPAPTKNNRYTQDALTFIGKTRASANP